MAPRIGLLAAGMALCCASQLCGASTLLAWDQQTLYSQSQATDFFSDTVTFNVLSPGMVGVGVSFRSWAFHGQSAISSFSASLIDAITNVTIDSNFGFDFPSIGGSYYINPRVLSVGTYTANLWVHANGTGLLEVDVLSGRAPFATLAPANTAPEPSALLLAALSLGILAFARRRRTGA